MSWIQPSSYWKLSPMPIHALSRSSQRLHISQVHSCVFDVLAAFKYSHSVAPHSVSSWSKETIQDSFRTENTDTWNPKRLHLILLCHARICTSLTVVMVLQELLNPTSDFRTPLKWQVLYRPNLLCWPATSVLEP